MLADGAIGLRLARIAIDRALAAANAVFVRTALLVSALGALEALARCGAGPLAVPVRVCGYVGQAASVSGQMA